jgi:hypothetical protein
MSDFSLKNGILNSHKKNGVHPVTSSLPPPVDKVIITVPENISFNRFLQKLAYSIFSKKMLLIKRG